MNTFVDYYILSRLIGYIRNSVCQGAFLLPETIFKRFEKATKLSLGQKRQRQRYLAELKNNHSNLGFRFILACGSRGKRLHITSINNSYFNDNYDRETPYFQILLRNLQTTNITSIKVYDTLLTTTKITRKSIERVVHQLKNKAEQFGLIFFRTGRQLFVRLKYPYITKNYKKNLSKNTPQNYDIICMIAKDKELLRNTPNGEARFSKTNKLNAKAHCLRKKLANKFWDNCKVNCSMGMLYKFARNALENGYEDKVIEAKFEQALKIRHADATDMGLNTLNFSFKFEMSSTVSLANKYLSESKNQTLYERWGNLIKNFPKRKKTEYISSSKIKTSSTKKIFQSKEFNNNVPYPTQETISFHKCLEHNNMLNSKIHEEKMKKFLLSNKYNNRDIRIFQKFQRKLIPNEQIQPYIKKIVRMGILLAEYFSDHPKYNNFKRRI